MHLSLLNPSGPGHKGNWIPLQSPHTPGLSEDERIDAYQQWKDIAKQEIKTVAFRNANKVVKAIEELINKLNAEGINVRDAYLRHNHPFKVAALLLVDEQTYLSEAFNVAYTYSREYVEKLNEEILQFEISFASITDDTDEDAIYCEGYTLKREIEDE